MKILLTGGGTGGHISPLLAIAAELKKKEPTCHVIYCGEHGSRFGHMSKEGEFDQTVRVFAGKFRRYHGQSFLRSLLDVKTVFFNIRDAFYVVMGIFQSLVVVKRLNPDVVLMKGGFVGVPIGLAAVFWRIPIVTHDSDAIPGLANRIVARWARIHATGMPAEFYNYPKDSIRHVGVLVSKDYKKVTPGEQEEFKLGFGIPKNDKVLFVTGGSQGSVVLNELIVRLAPELLKKFPDLHILHIVGAKNLDSYDDFKDPRLHVEGFVSGMYKYSGAADVIVTRAGANTIAEFGVQAKACVVVPNPLLTGGHQTKNAEELSSKNAVIAVKQTDIDGLEQAIGSLLGDKALRETYANRLHEITPDDATETLSVLLLDLVKQNKHVSKQTIKKI